MVHHQNWFGPAVRRIVEGETKFSKIGNLAGANEMNGGTDLKAMDLQQLFLAMTEEVRFCCTAALPPAALLVYARHLA